MRTSLRPSAFSSEGPKVYAIDPRLERLRQKQDAKAQLLQLLAGLGLSTDEAIALLVDALSMIAPRLFADDLKDNPSKTLLPMPSPTQKNEYRRLWVLMFLAKEGPTSTAVLKVALGIAHASKDAKEFDNHLCVMHHRDDIEKTAVPHDGTYTSGSRLSRWAITDKGRRVLMDLSQGRNDKEAAE